MSRRASGSRRHRFTCCAKVTAILMLTLVIADAERQDLCWYPARRREVMHVEKADIDRWLEAYVAAWKSYDRGQIAALFTEDVKYRYHPYDEPVDGRDAVVGSWLGEGNHTDASTRDEAGTYDATYRACAVDGDVAVATGT